MTQLVHTVGGEPVTRVTLHVPGIGPWWADVDFDGDPSVSGRVTMQLGELELVGTIDPRQDGTRGLQRRSRVVAGAGGWATLLAARAYHNDAGVRARIVADDAATEVGESIETFTPAAERVGADYVRQTGAAARVLEDVIGGAAWWVDYAGRTHVGARQTSSPPADSYAVLQHDPAERLVDLDVEDLRAIGIGSRLTEGLDEPRVVRELELDVAGPSYRLRVWCVADGEAIGAGRLASLIRTLVARASDARLFGLYRYRVVRMNGDRVDLQALGDRPGLPSILPVSAWPGVAGAHADLSSGTMVLVQFIEGDRAQPVVTHFSGRDGQGFVPTRLTLASSSSAPNAARKGDAVRVTIPPGTFLVSATGGALNPSAVTVDGEITQGSSSVGIGGSAA